MIHIHRPSITPYLPAPEKGTGTAVVIAPGGGHRKLCLGHEGYALAESFAEHGIAAFVLKYRLSKEEGTTYTLEDHAMADTRRALRLIRSRAGVEINPARLGIIGFSAGGELAAYAATKSDPGIADATDLVERQSSRPDFKDLSIPGSLTPSPSRRALPPAFIALVAMIDRTFRRAWRKSI